MAAFMLQQCSELGLRGLITALMGNSPKKQCFKDLKRQLKGCAPELLTVFSTDEEEGNRLLHILEKAYLDGRYTSTFSISNTEINLLSEGAKQLHARAKQVFEGRLEKLALTFEKHYL